MSNIKWDITVEKMNLISKCEKEIISAIVSGDLDAGQLYNSSESIASYCVTEWFDGYIKSFGESFKHGGFFKVVAIPLLDNGPTAFPLLRYMSRETLLSLSPGIDSSKSIKGCHRFGEHKGAPLSVGVKEILSTEIHLENSSIIDHITMHMASLWVSLYLNCLDKFHLNRSEFLNAWNSLIARDIYGREDTRKVAAMFRKILKDPYDRYLSEMLSLARYHVEHGSDKVRSNDGRDFEKRCERLLVGEGWVVSTTMASGDFGGDLIAERDGLRWCIQCKDTSKPAGVQAVQQAAAAMGYYSCDYAAVVSSNGFTEQALALAARLQVSLFNEMSIKRLGVV